ncbi:glycerate kinase [Pseudomonas yamanorum]|uniref:Glycerate kinase n=1 Tax=Pseudomonas gingeri TaxID=117681 RepID=A0A7Y8BL44_9PSED|nr:MULTISPECIES: glycerate kinase [Pseudomonas]NVZ84552.1 glycerate kinase [Pseudomonas yamanorum]NWA86952.1 glycerate kinase [Pseudomonas sp. D2002]NWB47846.1 glycerate kinase [Pseudomonas gingeri]
MKIVIAPDSFKDSLSAQEVASAIARGIAEILPHAELVLCPMADGGEGTVDAILAVMEGESRRAVVRGPLGTQVTARWGWIAQSRTAIIEMAEASGLQRVPLQQRDACKSSSFGTGQLIREAMHAGAQKVILTIGGSATNDGGAGMLQALGARLLDESGNEIPDGGLGLSALTRIDLQRLDHRLQSVSFEVAADVDNPLCGPHGASFTFGRQKGATPLQLEALDHALSHFADCCAEELGMDLRDFPGAGAAGGMGFAARAFLCAEFRPGVEVVAELVGLAEKMTGADLVITGEGRCDAQTLRGKTPVGVARIARQQLAPVIILAGTLGDGYQALYEHGVDAAFALVSGPMTLAQACRHAPRLLQERAGDIARLWSIGRDER